MVLELSKLLVLDREVDLRVSIIGQEFLQLHYIFLQKRLLEVVCGQILKSADIEKVGL